MAMDYNKTIGNITIGSVIGYLGLNAGLYAYTFYTGENGEPSQPVDKVSVIMPSIETDNNLIYKAISSLKNNNVVLEYPDMFEFILVKDKSIDYDKKVNDMFDIIMNAPLGKLNARHLGILKANHDIIMAVDADRYYPKNWVNAIVKPLNKIGTIATTDYVIYLKSLEPFSAMSKLLYFSQKMDGGGSAFIKQAYFDVGGFNLKMNQFNWSDLIKEEEILFKKRLDSIGKTEFILVPSYSVNRPSAPYRLGIS